MSDELMSQARELVDEYRKRAAEYTDPETEDINPEDYEAFDDMRTTLGIEALEMLEALVKEEAGAYGVHGVDHAEE